MFVLGLELIRKRREVRLRVCPGQPCHAFVGGERNESLRNELRCLVPCQRLGDNGCRQNERKDCTTQNRHYFLQNDGDE